ncbi:MAG: hypothetical protein HY507_01225 [Candidatus Zambryskibacteria bacterium]|nr:hypothetical protein [Candidatus Zambryskibacteria bacterium]
MTEAILLQLNREKNIFWTLIATVFLCVGFYIYFINTTIHNTVLRQNLENEISRLTLSTGSEEFQYIAMRNKINLPLAYSLGFRDVAVKTFISKKSLSQVSYLTR